MTRSDEKYLWNTAKSITHIHAPRQTQTLYTSSSLPPSCHHHHLNLVPVEATHITEGWASLLTMIQLWKRTLLVQKQFLSCEEGWEKRPFIVIINHLHHHHNHKAGKQNLSLVASERTEAVYKCQVGCLWCYSRDCDDDEVVIMMMINSMNIVICHWSCQWQFSFLGVFRWLWARGLLAC